MIFGYDEVADEVIIQDADGRITITMTYGEMTQMVDFVDDVRNKSKGGEE